MGKHQFRYCSDDDIICGHMTIMQGVEFVYEDHWGEQLSSVVDPVTVVMDVESEECAVMDIGENVSGEDEGVKR